MSQEVEVEEEHPGLGAARRRCHGARDAFYGCVDRVTAKGEEPWTRERPVPAPCLALRGAFQAGCRASWVRHFDGERSKGVRVAKYLQRKASTTNQSADPKPAQA